MPKIFRRDRLLPGIMKAAIVGKFRCAGSRMGFGLKRSELDTVGVAKTWTAEFLGPRQVTVIGV